MATRENKGAALHKAASKVAYERGLSGLTLANVAEAAGMPLGSLYYYFKSRDDMVCAAVSQVASQLQARRTEWDALGSSRLALRAFAGMTLGDAEMLTRHGCPVGTLAAQMGKQHQAGSADLGRVFTDLSDWAGKHFRQLGLDTATARQAGRKMVRDLEGAAMLAHATGDRTHISEVVDDILATIDALAGAA